MNCTICDSPNTKIYKKIQSPYIDAFYNLYNCLNCNSYFIDSHEHDVDLNELYNDSIHEVGVEFKKSYIWKRQVKIISKLLPDKGSISVIDIGCRTGDFLLHFDSSFSLNGVEINKANANIAANRGINTYIGNIENIVFDKKFDIVTCFAILEHIAKPYKFMEKIVSIVEKNGLLVIMIPTIESILRENLDKKNIHWHMYSPPEHLSYYSKYFLDSFLQKEGFVLEKRYFSSGGLAGIYSKFLGNSFYLLKDTSYEKLRTYYFGKSKASVLKKCSLLLYKIILKVLDGLVFFNKHNYFDHMYSYYRKK